MADWQAKVIELLRTDTNDLVSLARLAGADPATFYLGADLSEIELTPAEAAALAGSAGASEQDEQPPLDAKLPPSAEHSSSRKGVLAIYIGALTAQVARPSVGLVVQEPSVVLRRRKGRHLVGQAAIDRFQPDSGEHLLAPFNEDKISDPEPAADIVRHLIRTSEASRAMGGLEILCAVPATATSVQRRAIEESCRKAGARRVRFVDAPLAAAIGAGLVVDTPRAAMVLVVGDYLAEVQVMSLSGRVATYVARAGAEVMDQAIIDHMRRRYDMLIGQVTARRIWETIGSAYRTNDDESEVEVRGRSMTSGRPLEYRVSTSEISSALHAPVGDIGDLATRAMQATPPELSIDIGEAGFVLTGPGAALEGLGLALARRTGLRVTIPQAPERTVIDGCAKILENPAWSDLPFVEEAVVL